MPDYRYMVFTNATEGMDAEFNAWYNEIHLPEVLAISGFKGATRVKIVPQGDTKPRHRYLAIYEISVDDAPALIAELFRRAASGELNMSETMSPDIEGHLYEVITPHRSAK